MASGPLRPVRFWAATLRDLARTAAGDRHARSTRSAASVRSSRPSVRPAAGRRPRRLAQACGRRRASRSRRFIILTLGIGASTAIFSVVDAVALRGLPFDEASRLVSVAETDAARRRAAGHRRPTELRGVASATDRVRDDGRVRGRRALHDRRPPRGNAWTVKVTASLFDVLRVSPALGRAFRASDQVPGAPNVAHRQPQPVAPAIQQHPRHRRPPPRSRDRNRSSRSLGVGNRRRDARRVHLPDRVRTRQRSRRLDADRAAASRPGPRSGPHLQPLGRRPAPARRNGGAR